MLGIDRRAASYTFTAALILLLLSIVYLVRQTLFIFILALLFAYLLAPLVSLLDRFLPGNRTRAPALALAYIIFMGLVGFAGFEIGSRVADEASNFAKRFPEICAAEARFLAEVLGAEVDRREHMLAGCSTCEYHVRFNTAQEKA